MSRPKTSIGLTEGERQAIRDKLAAGLSVTQIVAQCGVSDTTVRSIRNAAMKKAYRAAPVVREPPNEWVGIKRNARWGAGHGA